MTSLFLITCSFATPNTLFCYFFIPTRVLEVRRVGLNKTTLNTVVGFAVMTVLVGILSLWLDHSKTYLVSIEHSFPNYSIFQQSPARLPRSTGFILIAPLTCIITQVINGPLFFLLLGGLFGIPRTKLYLRWKSFVIVMILSPLSQWSCLSLLAKVSWILLVTIYNNTRNS